MIVEMLDAPCAGLLPVVKIIYRLVKIFQWGIPIALILYGTIDLGKAVIASDEKEIKSAQSRLIKRFIYAALVFLVVALVEAFMNLVASSGSDDSDTSSWQDCWSAARG